MTDIEVAFAAGVDDHRAGRLDLAVTQYERVLDSAPGHAPALHALGVVRHQQGRHAEAIASITRAVALKPDYPEARYNLGLALFAAKRMREAIAEWSKVAAARPDFADVLCNLAAACNALNESPAAEAHARRALALRPDLAAAHYNLGVALSRRDELEAAEAEFAEAGRLQPDWTDPPHARGICLVSLGRLDEAKAVYRRALAIAPDLSGVHSNLIVAEQYTPGVTVASLAAAHADWAARHGVATAAVRADPDRPRDPERVLRIGLVSPDFCRHPVGYFTLGFVRNADRRRLTIVCYADRGRRDDYTGFFAAAADVFADIQGLDDDALAARIRADGIDVLVDLAGHTAYNRLRLFARKPAPIQVTWAGYVGTTGLSTIDALIADEHHVPLGEEAHYAERVIRLPGGYIAWNPLDHAPSAAPPPFPAAGVITFGCFNNPAKINAPLLDLWGRILAAVPGSRLLLKYRGAPDNCGRILAGLAPRGIDPARVSIEGSGTAQEMLLRYGAVDIALDTQPYSGGLTTLEALWMGVPVVTWPGRSFAGRHSAAHLRQAGLSELVARDPEDYIARVVALACEPARLVPLRDALRGRVAASTLSDPDRLARELEDALRGLWRDWCRAGG